MTRSGKIVPAFANGGIAAVFAAYPDAIRTRLLTLRAMILTTAEQIDGVGPLEETLKWGQPSYLTTQTGSGSTIRIDRQKADDRGAMYFQSDRSGRDIPRTLSDADGLWRQPQHPVRRLRQNSRQGVAPLYRACADLSRAQESCAQKRREEQSNPGEEDGRAQASRTTVLR